MKKILVIIMAILVLPSFAGKAALVVVDFQDMFVSSKYAWKKLTKANNEEIQNNVSLLEKNQEGNYFLPILVTFNKELAGVDSLDDVISPIPAIKKAAGKDAIVFEKERNSAFTQYAKRGGKSFDFGKFLKSEGIDTLVVSGLNQNACVLATVKSAINAKLTVIVANDLMFTSGSDKKVLEDPYAKEGFKKLLKKGLVLLETKEEVIEFLKKQK